VQAVDVDLDLGAPVFDDALDLRRGVFDGDSARKWRALDEFLYREARVTGGDLSWETLESGNGLGHGSGTVLTGDDLACVARVIDGDLDREDGVLDRGPRCKMFSADGFECKAPSSFSVT
jgi:hypothetical protein